MAKKVKPAPAAAPIEPSLAAVPGVGEPPITPQEALLSRPGAEEMVRAVNEIIRARCRATGDTTVRKGEVEERLGGTLTDEGLTAIVTLYLLAGWRVTLGTEALHFSC